jgi:hypothetical protein
VRQEGEEEVSLGYSEVVADILDVRARSEFGTKNKTVECVS